MLETFPMMGRRGRETGTRELVVVGLPYLVVYQATSDIVDILAVLHTSRKPKPRGFGYLN